MLLIVNTILEYYTLYSIYQKFCSINSFKPFIYPHNYYYLVLHIRKCDKEIGNNGYRFSLLVSGGIIQIMVWLSSQVLKVLLDCQYNICFKNFKILMCTMHKVHES